MLDNVPQQCQSKIDRLVFLVWACLSIVVLIWLRFDSSNSLETDVTSDKLVFEDLDCYIKVAVVWISICTCCY